MWDHWLAYDHPYADAMCRAATATLEGEHTAIVRQQFHPATGINDPYRFTLFTRPAETPDPAATLAAALRFKPAGVLLDHVVSTVRTPAERRPANRAAERLAKVVHEAGEAIGACMQAHRDGHAPASIKSKADEERARRTADARWQVEAAIETGLRARLGFFLLPPAILTAEALHDLMAWRFVWAARCFLFSGLPSVSIPLDQRTWHPEGLSVCRGCTLVFAPKRRSTADYCSMCEKRPAAPPLGSPRGGTPDGRQTVRLPNIQGGMIRGWRTATIGVCSECGESFIARRADAVTCGASCRVRRCRATATRR